MSRNIKLSMRRQCELLGISRSSVYYQSKGFDENTLEIMRMMDELHIEEPAAGSRMLRDYLNAAFKKLPKWTGGTVCRKKVHRLMKHMVIEAVYPKKRTTIPGGPEGIRPYLLRNLDICRPNQVWCADITYIPMKRGFMYLFAIMDWHSRKILAWELSNTLDTEFCLSTLHRAVVETGATPEIFNTDQGCQFTSTKWIESLEKLNIRISMDGKGCWVDNVMIERFWRSIKYDDIYLNAYENGRELERGIKKYILRYNHRRPHGSLNKAVPHDVYCGAVKLAA